MAALSSNDKKTTRKRILLCLQLEKACEAERFGGLEVDDKLVLGRRLHRQVGVPNTQRATLRWPFK